MLTYGQVKAVLAKYAGTAGKCSTSNIDLFVKMVLQYLLLHGTYGNERKFTFHAERGVITLPKELETPLKIKFDGVVGSVWDRWFEYHSGNLLDVDCIRSDAILEEPNLFPTVYDIPSCGAYPAVMGTCKEADDAHVVIKGTDPTGREIYSVHKGEHVTGVYLSIKKGILQSSSILFGKITSVYKTETNGYVNLVGLLDDSGCNRKFLADYAPYETAPGYRRIRVVIPDCPPVCKVSVLGRIRLKDRYADDDVVPFDNLYLIQTAGQTVNSMANDDIQVGLEKDKYVKGLIETEGQYKKINNGQTFEINKVLSGGSIKNAGRARRVYRSRYI